MKMVLFGLAVVGVGTIAYLCLKRRANTNVGNERSQLDAPPPVGSVGLNPKQPQGGGGFTIANVVGMPITEYFTLPTVDFSMPAHGVLR